MKNSMEEILNSFETIALEDTGKVRFLKRCDFKYILSLDDLEKILEEAREFYYVMSIRGGRIQSYKTTYFDTEDDLFYFMHHSGHNNRFKVRKREYESTNERFFEIKKKNLAGQTKKKRINTLTDTSEEINETEMSFMDKIITVPLSQLQPKLDTMFSRITLVSRLFNERVTIDLDLSFRNVNGNLIKTKNFAVVEVKCDQYTKKTLVRQSLKKYGIRSMGFSKYCIGRAITDETLKHNQFKQKIKILKTTYC